MSIALMCNCEATHGYMDNLKSLLYILLWSALMYIPTSFTMSYCSMFIAQMFNNISADGAGGRGKKLFLCNLEELYQLEKLFSNCPILDDLLRDLVRVFGCHYATGPWEHDFALKSGNRALKSEPQSSSLKEFKGHETVLHIFTKYLEQPNWPANSTAKLHNVSCSDPFGKNISTQVFSKSTHTLECDDTRKPKRFKADAVEASDTDTDGDNDYSTELLGDVTENNGSTDTILSPLTPLPSSDRLG